MEVAPTVTVIMKGFLKKDHQIGAIPGKPERLALNVLVATLKGGRLFGHTALCMSPAEHKTIQHSLPPFVLALPPGKLTFSPGDTTVGWEDTKILYNKNVYTFELETNIITTALKNIIMAKIDTASYVVFK